MYLNYNREDYIFFTVICWRCSNYIFILDLTPGLKGLGKDDFKTRWESFKFWDLVRLILEILRYIQIGQTDPMHWKCSFRCHLYHDHKFSQADLTDNEGENTKGNNVWILTKLLPYASYDCRLVILGIHRNALNWYQICEQKI